MSIDLPRTLPLFLSASGTLTSAAAATAVSLIPDASVPAGMKLYLLGWQAKVNGADAWVGTVTKVIVEDTAGVAFLELPVAILLGNALIGPLTANVTQKDAWVLGTGGTASKGLRIKGDANASVSGSDVVFQALFAVR